MHDNIIRPEMPQVNPQLLKLATQLLDDVKAGRVTTVAVISVGALGNLNQGACGAQGEAIYVGCDMLKNQIIAGMSQRPAIVRGG